MFWWMFDRTERRRSRVSDSSLWMPSVRPEANRGDQRRPVIECSHSFAVNRNGSSDIFCGALQFDIHPYSLLEKFIFLNLSLLISIIWSPYGHHENRELTSRTLPPEIALDRCNLLLLIHLITECVFAFADDPSFARFVQAAFKFSRLFVSAPLMGDHH